jgi:hypothetical protein
MISYDGSSLLNEEQQLIAFTDLEVRSNLPARFTIPERIQAEDFYYNNGLVLEECQDNGGGYNTGYANPGDYLDYLIYVPKEDKYTINFRVASNQSSAQLIIQHNQSGEYVSIDTLIISGTGGWQNWETQTAHLTLPQGRYTFRLLVLSGEHNLNWFDFNYYSLVHRTKQEPEFIVYPNPIQDQLNIKIDNIIYEPQSILIYDVQGKLLYRSTTEQNEVTIDVAQWPNGMYLIRVFTPAGISLLKKIIIRD